eukprot:TRINITY_DN47473_c0_g1_i1.p1 TRINITY_DN47473_c0_g1~~TRINITY_DN47473_c0_g1_i1.p1  ORF type:complete len:196 (-),score=42.02 TRINITY_DN47473_c0_g1_i1:60-647(-)
MSALICKLRLCSRFGAVAAARTCRGRLRLAVLAPRRRWLADSRRPLVDLSPEEGGEDAASSSMAAPQNGVADPEEIRSVARHPRMVSLEVATGKSEVTLRRREMTIKMSLDEFPERIRHWGWESSNCHRPLLLFGDEAAEVAKVRSYLVEEGFTAVCNAQSRQALVDALRKPPQFIAGKKGNTPGNEGLAPSAAE